MRKDIVFINGRQTYPFFQGGDGVSTNFVLARLAQEGFDVESFGCINPHDRAITRDQIENELAQWQLTSQETRNDGISYRGPGDYKSTMVPYSCFLDAASQYIGTNRPRLIITQLENSQDLIPMANSLGSRVVHFVHDTTPINLEPLAHSDKADHVVFNSNFTFNHFRTFVKCDSSVIYPPIELAKYRIQRPRPEFLTMINPVESKGVKIMNQLMPYFPQEKFLLVRGWKTPELIFSEHNNAIDASRTYDMTEIYKQTKILLVPSQWEETFARVVPEAMVSGIPIIASKTGGLPESVGNGGILVEDFRDPKIWVETLRSLLGNLQLQDSLGRNGVEHVNMFESEAVFGQLKDLFQNLMTC